MIRPEEGLACILCGRLSCLSLTLRTIPVGLAYGIWSGLGIVLNSLIGWWVFGQTLGLPTTIGIGLIIAGMVVVNPFSMAMPYGLARARLPGSVNRRPAAPPARRESRAAH